MSETKWTVGQTVVIDRSTIATVEKVTPSGRATVAGKVFNPNGRERASGYRVSRIELLTPEIEAEMALVERRRSIYEAGYKAIIGADRWLRDTFSPYRHNVPEVEDCERAERLIAAIEVVMKKDTSS